MKPTFATTTTPLRTDSETIPAGTHIEIVEEIHLGHYSSSLAYFDLRLSTGEILRMVHIYRDLDYPIEVKAKHMAA